nr:MAG TPA_asm: hypothetical protein [Caudoviricetes sp.]DAQ34261.1 MAG TPA: hypothetical protein [Caudoviricetes sp.]
MCLLHELYHDNKWKRRGLVKRTKTLIQVLEQLLARL